MSAAGHPAAGSLQRACTHLLRRHVPLNGDLPLLKVDIEGGHACSSQCACHCQHCRVAGQIANIRCGRTVHFSKYPFDSAHAASAHHFHAQDHLQEGKQQLSILCIDCCTTKLSTHDCLTTERGPGRQFAVPPASCPSVYRYYQRRLVRSSAVEFPIACRRLSTINTINTTIWGQHCRTKLAAIVAQRLAFRRESHKSA